MRLLVVAVVLALLAAPALSQRAEKSVPIGRPGEGSKGDDGGPVSGQWSTSPTPPAAGLYLPLYAVDGAPTKAWLHLTANQPIDDDLRLAASPSPSMSLNRTVVRVTLAEGASVAIPFLIGAAIVPGSSSGLLEATFNSTRDPRDTSGQPYRISGSIEVLPKVSVGFASPKPEYQDVGYGLIAVPKHVGVRSTVPFDLVAHNPGTSPSAAFDVTVQMYGRSLRNATVPALAAGETKTFRATDFQLARDAPEFTSGTDFGFAATLDFQIWHSSDPAQGFRPVYRYDFADGRLSNVRQDSVQIQFHAGVSAEAKSVNVTLAKPSHIDIEVTNWGEEAANGVRVDVRASPVPAANYGAGSFLKDTFYVSVGAGETKHVNITFTPQVAGTFQVSVQPFLSGYSQPIVRTFELPTPVTVRPQESPAVVILARGATARVTFTINSSANFTGGEILFALADATGQAAGDVPYVRFITADDILQVEATPSKFDLKDNRLVWVNATLDLKTAGVFRLVPYYRVGDLSYVGRPVATAGTVGGGPIPVEGGFFPGGGSFPGSYEVRGEIGPFALGFLWLPVGSVVVGFVGYWVARRRLVL